MTRRHAALTFLIAALAFATLSAKDKWIAVRTPHLNIVSNATERATRNIAERLERFVDGLSTLAGTRITPDVPVTVMVFRNDASFAPFRPRQDGRTMNLSGYFQRADDENLIALSLETPGIAKPYRVIFHEYAHALMARSAVLWPLWLQEGLADLYSAFQTDANRFAVGEPILDHVRLLRDEKVLPLAELLSVDQNSPAYRDDNQDDFYAASWALTHFLTFGDKGKRRPALNRFIDGVSHGLSTNRAFQNAFQTDEKSLEVELRRYLAEARYTGANLSVQQPARNVSAVARELSDAEAEVFQGSLLMRVGRGDEADAHFRRARMLDPSTPRLEESLGFLSLARARYDDAAAHLKTAIAHDPKNSLAHYYYAETLRRQLMEQGQALSPAVARAMAEPLRAVIALDPRFARAYYLLGYAHSVTGEDLGEGVRLLQTAIQLAPPHRAATLTLASIQLKLRDYAVAKATAESIVRATDASEAMRSEARLIAAAADHGLRP